MLNLRLHDHSDELAARLRPAILIRHVATRYDFFAPGLSAELLAPFPPVGQPARTTDMMI